MATLEIYGYYQDKEFKANLDTKTGKVTYRRKVYNSLSAAAVQAVKDGGRKGGDAIRMNGWDFWGVLKTVRGETFWYSCNEELRAQKAKLRQHLKVRPKAKTTSKKNTQGKAKPAGKGTPVTVTVEIASADAETLALIEKLKQA